MNDRGRRGQIVLLVAPRDDIHALAVRARLNALGAGVNGEVLDTATFPAWSSVEWRFIDRHSSGTLFLAPPLPETYSPKALATPPNRRREIAFDEVRSVWLRRTAVPGISPEITVAELRRHAENATRVGLQTMFTMLEVHNPPDAERLASQKPYQLATAMKCGLAIPRTVVTSSPTVAREFVEQNTSSGRRTIYKWVAPAPDAPPTRPFEPSDLTRLADVALCPTMFQERIERGPDLRVAMVGTMIFAAEWRSADGPTELADVRLDRGARLWPVSLEPELQARLQTLHATLGLTLGVYDLKRDGSGRPFFLEVNPGGQWLDLEVSAGYPVSEAMARALAGIAPSGDMSWQSTFTDANLAQLAEDAEEGAVSSHSQSSVAGI